MLLSRLAPLVSVLSFSAFLASAACSSSSPPPAPAAATDAGAKEPEKPEDVPAVRLEADPATACPGNYATTPPQAGGPVQTDAPAKAQVEALGKTQNRDFVVAGQRREFVLLLPPDSFTGPRPILLAFNGTGENGPIFTVRAELQQFADAGFIVVAPSSKANGTIWPVWDGMRTDNDEAPNKDLELFDTLLACTAGHFEVDKNRIYVTGHSAGGIFTNYLAQRRSNILAGAIPASGIFSSTSPKPTPELEKMFVVVTWGGDNDKFSGSVGGVTVPEANFVSEASLATKFYNGQKNVGAANCRGTRMDHVWLPINDWFIKVLLDHPKGLPGNKGIELPPVEMKGITCTTDVFEFTGTSPQVTCASSGTEGCQQSCQLFADCAVENPTVKSALAPQLTKLGFSGTNCAGCITTCEANSDAEVLSCMKGESESNGGQCGEGIDGAQPLIAAINTCCAGKRTSSPYCKKVCDIISENSVAISYFKACK